MRVTLVSMFFISFNLEHRSRFFLLATHSHIQLSVFFVLLQLTYLLLLPLRSKSLGNIISTFLVNWDCLVRGFIYTSLQLLVLLILFQSKFYWLSYSICCFLKNVFKTYSYYWDLKTNWIKRIQEVFFGSKYWQLSSFIDGFVKYNLNI